jgi:hypothetical protein
MQTTLTTNTSTAWTSAHDGNVFIQAVGTFGGGTLTVEIQLPDGTTTQAVEDGAFTAGPVSQSLRVPNEMPVRLTLAGATNPSIVTLVRQGGR